MSELLTLSLIWRPFVAPGAILVGVVVLVVLAGLACRRAFAGAPVLSVIMLVMRLALIVVLAVLMMGPSDLPPTQTRMKRPRLTVMLDTSASMQSDDMPNSSRIRWAADRWLSSDQIRAWHEHYDVTLVGFDDSTHALNDTVLRQPAETIAPGSVSNIVRSVSDVIAGVESGKDGAALLVISDGHDSADPSISRATDLARARSLPVHTVALGGPTLQRDVLLVAAPMQEYLLADEPGVIRVHVMQTGAPEGSTRLHVRGGNEPIDMTVRFKGRNSAEVDIPVQHARAGLYEYKLAVDALPGEIESGNNEQSVFVRVTQKRMRVLLVEGEPYWDTKFLGQALRSDEQIELTHITQVSNNRRQKSVTRGDVSAARLPRTREELNAYDVIILGRRMDRVIDEQLARWLRDYVAVTGGRLIFARGRAYDPHSGSGPELAALFGVMEPVTWGQGRWTDARISLTPAGRVSPIFALRDDNQSADWILSRLPEWDGLARIKRPKAAAIVLAHGDAGTSHAPAVLSMNYGSGCIIAVLGDGLWRWELLGEDLVDLRGVFDRLWSNTVRWMVLAGNFQPGREMSLRMSRRSVRLGDAVTLDVVSRMAVGTTEETSLTVVTPDGIHRRLALRVSSDGALQRTTFEPTMVGVHRVIVESSEAGQVALEDRFSAFDVDTERLHSSANPMLLRTLAQQTGGRMFGADETDAFEDTLRRQRVAMSVPPKPVYVWDRGWLMTLLLSWASLEWIIRRLGGLL